MKYLKLTVVIVVAALGLMAADAMAQIGVRRNPNAATIENPFKGVVENVSSASLTVKGEVKLANPPRNNPNGDTKSKPMLQNVHFRIKGSKLTRDGKPCELKDIQKGDTATVTFTTKEGSETHIASEIDVTKGSGDAGEKKTAGKK